MRARLLHSLAITVVATALPLAAAPAQTVAITGGKVYPVSGPPIENGTVIIRDGRITAVGANIAVPEGAQRVDATGKIVTPGFINGQTQLGVMEIGAVRATRDFAAEGKDGVAAAFTVWEGLNPTSVLITPARNEGITSVVVTPAGGLISGQAAIVDLVEGTAADMVVKAPVAMVAQVGDPREGGGLGARGELLVRLREILDDVKAYQRRKADFERAQTREFAVSRTDLEALIPVVEGRLPLVIAADKSSDIEAALKLARDYGLKIMIAGGAEAWMVARELAAAKVPVFTGAMNNIPSSFASLGTRQENAALLRQAGVDVILIGNAGGGDEEAFNVRNLKQEAGNAIAYGLSWDDALRAVTLAPAQLFGVSDRIGSLQPGRVANVVVWSADPFEFGTRAEHVFVRGREITEPSRQDMLEQRYRSLPPDYYKP